MANIKQRLLASSILIAGLGLYLPLYKQIYQVAIEPFKEGFMAGYEKPRKPCHRKTLLSTGSGVGVAISPNGREIYKITDDGIKVIDNDTGKQSYFELPNGFPELSWGTDIAYDSKRDLVSLVSLGGEGYFYRFDANKRRWLDVRSLDDLDLKSITYDRTTDRYVAWGDDWSVNRSNLFFISATGELLSKESLSDRLPGFYQLYDRHNEMPPTVEIITMGNNLTLMVFSNNSLQSVWHYDLDLETIQQTYKSSKRSRLYAD